MFLSTQLLICFASTFKERPRAHTGPFLDENGLPVANRVRFWKKQHIETQHKTTQTQKREQLHLENAFRKQLFDHRCRNRSSEVLDVTEHFDIFEAWGEYISLEKCLRKEMSKRGFEKIRDPSKRFVIPSRVDLADGEDFDEAKSGG